MLTVRQKVKTEDYETATSTDSEYNEPYKYNKVKKKEYKKA